MINKLLILLFIISVIAGCGESGDQPVLVGDDDVVLVEVDGEPVTLPMLEFLMEVRGVEEEDTEGMRKLLDELIRLRAVANRAAKEGVSTRKRVRAERMIKDIEVQYVRYVEEFQRDNPVSDEQIESVYQAQVERAGDRRYKIETIEFPGQSAALAELDALQAGSLDFEQAIEKASAERRVARRTDWIDASQVPEDFAEVLRETEPGSVVETLLPYQNQWLIVRVVDVDSLQPPALEEVREGIRQTLMRERTQAMIEQTFDQAEITPMLPIDETPTDPSP